MHLRVRRVDLYLAVDLAQAHARNRGFEGEVGVEHGRRSCIERQTLKIGFFVNTEHHDRDLRRVCKSFGKERAQGAVDKTRGQGLKITRLALAFKKSSRHLSRSISFLEILYGQRKKISLNHLIAVNSDRCQQDRIADFEPCCSICLTRDFFKLIRLDMVVDLKNTSAHCHPCSSKIVSISLSPTRSKSL